jgi:hypothetical protein
VIDFGLRLAITQIKKSKKEIFIFTDIYHCMGNLNICCEWCTYIDSTSMDLHAKKLSRHENNQINPDNPRTKPPKHVKNTLCPQQDLQVVTHPSNLIHIPLNNSISTWTPSPVLGC